MSQPLERRFATASEALARYSTPKYAMTPLFCARDAQPMSDVLKFSRLRPPLPTNCQSAATCAEAKLQFGNDWLNADAPQNIARNAPTFAVSHELMG
jgi:hypothetical protein